MVLAGLLALFTVRLLYPDPGFQLRFAVFAGQESRVRELLAADPNLVNRTNQFVMSEAIRRKGRDQILIYWKARRLDPTDQYVNCSFNMREAYGATPLFQAAAAGHLVVAEFLIRSGANIDARMADQATPLLGAVRSAQPALVRLLLSAGADLKVLDQFGETPLHIAARLGSEHNTRECVTALLAKGADPNAVDAKTGMTPLHRAASHGNSHLCRILLEAGANPNLKDKWGRTAFDIAQGIALRLDKPELVQAVTREKSE